MRHDNLFDRIANFQALRKAARLAIRGKRKKPGAVAFQFGLERELLRLERELQAQTYKPGRYTAQNLRSANRNRNTPTNRNNNLGFRIARTPAPPELGRSRSHQARAQASRAVR